MKKRFLGFLGFSLVELMISLITISCIAAAFTPVITKKLKKQDIALSLAQTSEITNKCHKGETYPYGNDTDGYKCELCTKAYCINCELKCEDGKYAETSLCICKNCSDNKSVIGENCINCTKDKCILCESGYYLKGLDGVLYSTCQKCGKDKISGKDNICMDGINEQSPDFCLKPPSGYFCDGTKLKACSEKYEANCSTCNETKCTGCISTYHLDSSGKCAPCGIGSCYNCQECNGKDGYCPTCSGCYTYSYLASDRKSCIGCTSALGEGCYRCDSAGTYCTLCFYGYYLNSGKRCTKCTLSNCMVCANGRSATSPACQECLPGYYIKNGTCATCASKYGAECSACDSSYCHSCKQGYNLTNNNKGCEPVDYKWGCSDSNFMQIGNLCVTRKNMGDSTLLKIPSSINIADATDYCFTTREKCCWKGQTSTDCNSENVSYSGCNRTMCNWAAADEICANFNYNGVKWRLPTDAEISKMLSYSVNLWENGLMLCDERGATVYGSPRCNNGNGRCKGTPYTRCLCSYWWGSDKYHKSIDQAQYYSGGIASGTEAMGVRCVTEMSNFK